VTADTTIAVGPRIKGDKNFTDFLAAAGTLLTLPGILAYSSNVGTIKIADRLGADASAVSSTVSGLGETGVGVPGEAGGGAAAGELERDLARLDRSAPASQ
jgi:cell division protein FtsI (penicillin-binding protein 3)